MQARSSNTSLPENSPHDSGVEPLRLIVQGLAATEHTLLDIAVRLSHQRTPRRGAPRLELIAPEQLVEANVIMIGSRDAAAMDWARQRAADLQDKPVIWVDGSDAPAGHLSINRPVLWASLPKLLTRAIAQYASQASTAARDSAPEQRFGTESAQDPGLQPVAPVLVIDDSVAMRSQMRSILEQQGYIVKEAADAHEGLDMLAKSNYALVLMDVVMPDLDGYDACKRIKAQPRVFGAVPVVMLTSRGSRFDHIYGGISGCDGYLVKPAETDALQEVLQRFVGVPATPPAQISGTELTDDVEPEAASNVYPAHDSELEQSADTESTFDPDPEQASGAEWAHDSELEQNVDPEAAHTDESEQASDTESVYGPESLTVAPVLVIDDSITARSQMRSILEQQGYIVEEAADAHEGLDMLSNGSYALVLMDVVMPDLDGYDACKRIKAQPRVFGAAPVVMLTSRGSRFDQIYGGISGCDGYLVKPAETSALQEVLQRFASGSATPPADPAVIMQPAISDRDFASHTVDYNS